MMLTLPLPVERYPPKAMASQQQKRLTQDALIAILLEAAEQAPLLTFWEDLHWADPSTLELLGRLIEQVPTVSILVIATARPEFVPPWPKRSHITPITLDRLERSHAEALVVRIAGSKYLPLEVIDHIATKTDGVPLYAEELTKAILASNILFDAGDCFELTGPLASLSIPDTLQESLMARLDRLPQVRELAQLGSVEAHPELVAHHFNGAAEPVRAVLYWQKAAEQAALELANLEAIGHAEQGLSILAIMSEEAIALLSPVYDWFTEGLNTSHLLKAKTLLGE